MCGITGILAFNLVGKMNMIQLANATQALSSRGPDFQDMVHDQFAALGHRRLSVIDTSPAGHQPMWDETKRYAIVYNGEIFNFRELKKELENKGIAFTSQSDTEVILRLYNQQKEACLEKLNGFFAFCIYDKEEQSFFLARDRFGVKPLLYLADEDKFLFASEMKSLVQYGIDKSLDYESLLSYLQLNYIPAPDTIFTAVKKLMPGHYMKVRQGKIDMTRYYSIPYDPKNPSRDTYESALGQFKNLLEAAVQRRLVADVPLGTFLSGGIDSSVVTGLAIRHKPDLHTFSIGFRDDKFFDETVYATLVARHFNTNHTVFSLTNNDLLAHVSSILDYIDEPFADSSAINVYILSRETRKHATVALSGDGADELLGGYNKHAAHYRAINRGWKENAVSALHPLWNALPSSRHGGFSNKVRQLKRFSEGIKYASSERYWHWASFASLQQSRGLLSEVTISSLNEKLWQTRKSSILAFIPDHESVNDILVADLNLVLPNDMLTKVDLMSMANSLEVRSPFLDYELVNYVVNLPASYKINSRIRKRILQDAYREFLPPALYNRPKKGFEVPLLTWFRKEMKTLIMDDLLSQKLIEEQGIFSYRSIARLKKQLFSSNPGDVHARIWALLVFQHWWKKYFK